MPILINLDVMLAKRKMSVTELAEKVGITMANISILKNGKAKATPHKSCRQRESQEDGFGCHCDGSNYSKGGSCLNCLLINMKFSERIFRKNSRSPKRNCLNHPIHKTLLFEKEV